LDSNREYFGRVRAVGGVWSGIYASTYTWPNSVVDLKPVAASVATHAVKFNWGHGRNWANNTAYELVLTTGVGPARHEVKSLTTGMGVTDHEFGAGEGVVWANEEYTVSVKVVSADGNPSHNSGEVTSSTWTAILQPQDLRVITETTDNMTVGWFDTKPVVSQTIANSPNTEYEVFRVDGASISLGRIKQPVTNEFLIGSLTPNKLFGVQVKALSNVGNLWLPVQASTQGVTRAMVPNPGLFRLYTTSATLNWDVNTNPVGTGYRVEMDVKIRLIRH
ncbi:MAG: fibronectin type III domain-containing protein, partial [Elusimicrobia bacterium]|nr:fibronectin type III domain-containing protein [Elusimicrobiota bacterium]